MIIAESKKVRVGWIISGDRSKASSRLQGYNIHKHLLEKGYYSNIIFDNFNKKLENFNFIDLLQASALVRTRKITHLVLENPEWKAVQISSIAKEAGVKTICVRCDHYPFPYDNYFDLTITPTTELADALSIKNRLIIEDMVDIAGAAEYGFVIRDRPKLKVCWIGHEGYKNYIIKFISDLRSCDSIADAFEFITISNGPEFTHQWSEKGAIEVIRECDIAIIPIPPGEWFASKSSNRLAMMLTLGLPSIVSPLPSYTKLLGDSDSAIVAKNFADFISALVNLRDVKVRTSLSARGRELVKTRFTPAVVGDQWVSAILATRNKAILPTLKKAKAKTLLGLSMFFNSIASDS